MSISAALVERLRSNWRNRLEPPTNEEEDMTEAVLTAAMVMDDLAPGWERLIDLASLDIRSTCNCIGGQTFAAEEYGSGFGYLLLRMEEEGLDCWGFPAFFHDRYNEAWRDLIKHRFDAGTLSDEVS